MIEEFLYQVFFLVPANARLLVADKDARAIEHGRAASAQCHSDLEWDLLEWTVSSPDAAQHRADGYMQHDLQMP